LTATVDTNGDGVGDSGPYGTVISGLVSTVGSDVQKSKTASDGQDNLLAALKTQRDRVSAVNLDEEATSLITYQRSYQASAHFISVIDQLTAQLLTQFGA
jgi:flagellar hook-associated protein 1 FlgK